jgi:hypothetical protein
MTTLITFVKEIGLIIYYIVLYILVILAVVAFFTGALFVLWLVASLIANLLDPLFT